MTDAVRTSQRRRIVVALLAVVIAAAAWSVWKHTISPRLFPKRFGVVVEHALYRSGRIHPALFPKVLDRYGIDDVIALTYPPRGAGSREMDGALAENAAVRVQRFPLNGDGTGDPAHIVDALTAIHAALGRGEQVLVQCAAGSERTGGVVYLYRTLVLGDSPDAAYAELLSYGHRPRRNPHLEAFLNSHMVYFADALAQRGVPVIAHPLPHLPEVPDPPS